MSRWLQPGRLAGAVVLAFMGACIATPVAAALSHAQQVSLGMALGLVGVALLVPAYAVMALVGRDADRVVSRGEARRRQIAAMADRMARAPLPFECDPDAFAALVDGEVRRLPSEVARVIAERGTAVAVAEQDEDHPFALGLFQRRPLGAGLVGGGRVVDDETTITLFRRPLLHAAGIPERLPTAVRETLLHEVGHLLGMDERDLDRFSIGNNPHPDAVVVRPVAPRG